MSQSRRAATELRSTRWFAPDDLRGSTHRSRFMQMGYGPDDWQGRPVVAIINTWSDINPCHAHFKQRVEDIKRGVLQAGGLPMLKAWQGPFGDVTFCPTGGIHAGNAAEFLALSNVACVGGSWIVPTDAIRDGDWTRIEQLARAASQLQR